MAKRQFVYRAFTRTELKSRANIPDQVDITSVDAVRDYIDCSRIDRNKIRTLIEETTDGLKELCTSPNINVWSGFSPIIREVVDGILVNRVRIDSEHYPLDSFAGYNHSATAPYFVSEACNDIDCVANETIHFNCIINLGEAQLVDFDILNVNDPVRGLAMVIFDGPNVLMDGYNQVVVIVDLNNIGSSPVELDVEYTIPNGTPLSKTVTRKIFLCNNLTGFASDLSNAICQFNELPDCDITLRILSPNHFFLNGPENNSASHGSTFTSYKWDINNASFNTADGTMMVYYVKLNTLLTGSYNHLHVRAWVERGYFDQDGIWIGDIITTPYDHLYDGSWNQNLSEAFQVTMPLDIWNITDPIDTSGYGYRIVIDCNPSTI